MGEKVLLVLVDGMRPDSVDACGHPFAVKMRAAGSYTGSAQTVMPSVTLPCHMSLFYSVPPGRHGVTTNLYTPPVRPLNGICEQLRQAGKTCALFYNWGELRDIAKPDATAQGEYLSGSLYGYEQTNHALTDKAIASMEKYAPDFIFLYLGMVDVVGHDHGWMSAEYLRAVYDSWESIEKITRAAPEEYTVMVTADHGGHDRTHGKDMPEDMTIPLFLKGRAFAPGSSCGSASILNLAPTVARLLGAQAAPEWEGKPLC